MTCYDHYDHVISRLVPYQEPKVTMAQTPLTAEEARGLTRRVREKDAAAVAEAAGHVEQPEAGDAFRT